MRLEYIFIKNYRSINTQGFDLSNEFIISFNYIRKEILIELNPLYIKGFFGSNINSFTGIIGDNGSGKSTFLNFIKEVLSMPKIESKEYFCLLVFFKDGNDSKEFFVIDALQDSRGSTIEVKTSLNIPVHIQSLSDLNQDTSPDGIFDFDTTFSVLKSIPQLSELSIVYLATVFESTRTEITSSINVPRIYNYSTNYLLKKSMISEVGNYTRDEAKRILDFVVNASGDGPQLSYPKSIDIIVNLSKLNVFLSDTSIKKSELKKRERIMQNEFIVDYYYHAKRISDRVMQIKMALHISLLVEIFDYIIEDKIDEFFSKLSHTDTDSFFESIFILLKRPEEYLKNSSNLFKDKWNLPDNFWSEFIHNYHEMIILVLTILTSDKKQSSEIKPHYINVSLNKDNYEPIKRLIELNDQTSISQYSVISFIWPNASSGEISILSIFGRLYELSLILKNQHPPRSNPIWLLFDECDNSFHPQWQKQFNNLVLKFLSIYFKEFDCQIIFTSHSPLTISDLPKKNLVFLKQQNNGTVVQNSLNEHRQTFAANINVLLTDSFFIENGLIGDFANSKLNNLIDLLYISNLDDIMNKRDYIEKLINTIGEPLIKNKLLSMLEEKVRANLLTIKNDIDLLKNNNL